MSKFTVGQKVLVVATNVDSHVDRLLVGEFGEVIFADRGDDCLVKFVGRRDLHTGGRRSDWHDSWWISECMLDPLDCKQMTPPLAPGEMTIGQLVAEIDNMLHDVRELTKGITDDKIVDANRIADAAHGFIHEVAAHLLARGIV